MGRSSFIIPVPSVGSLEWNGKRSGGTGGKRLGQRALLIGPGMLGDQVCSAKDPKASTEIESWVPCGLASISALLTDRGSPTEAVAGGLYPDGARSVRMCTDRKTHRLHTSAWNE